MARIIALRLCTRCNHGTETAPVWVDVITETTMPYSEANEETAKRESYKGEYTIEEVEDVATALTVEERLTILEQSAEAPDEYMPGTWYYRGDKVLFNESVYTCIAPSGVVCVWSPLEYPQYWSKN